MQRATALLLVVFVHFHMTAYASMATGIPLTPEQSVLTCLGEVVFIASALAHVAVSLNRGLVTLGWLPSRTAQRRVERASIVVCAILGAVALFAVCRFFLGGIL